MGTEYDRLRAGSFMLPSCHRALCMMSKEEMWVVLFFLFFYFF